MARFKSNIKETRRGRHRGADPQARGHSDALAYYRARASQPKPAAAFDAEWSALDRAQRDARARPGAGTVVKGIDYSSGQSFTTWTTVSYGKTLWLTPSGISLMPSGPSEPPPPLENAGLRVGEIIAYRVWPITKNRRLQSGFRDDIWEPGEPMVGEPSDRDGSSPSGVHAFNDPNGAGIKDAIMSYGPHGIIHMWGMLNRFMWVQSRDGSISIEEAPAPEPAKYPGIAVGKVRLYGTVIEHVRGYRAQYAMVESIDRIADSELPDEERDALLMHLRSTYCTETE